MGLTKICLSPSILAADLGDLHSELKILADNGVPYVHIDVMDGHFTPNLTFGVPVVKSLRAKSDLVFDVHLMITNPLDFVKPFADAGADIITFHLEACESAEIVREVIMKIRSFNKRVGLSISPATPIENALPFLAEIDMLLVMSVVPGFGGQSFMPNSLDKIKTARAFATEHNLNLDIEVDGGITTENVSSVIKNGCNIIVAGSSVFKTGKTALNIKAFHDIFQLG